jgi:hypothetical protein
MYTGNRHFPNVSYFSVIEPNRFIHLNNVRGD